MEEYTLKPPYWEMRLICKIPGRIMCFNIGDCKHCEWADKYENPEKYLV